MTAKQNAWYWREWQAVRRFCAAHELPEPDRHALHIRALGADKSHANFTNKDFDRVLREFWAISKPDSVDAQMRQANMERTRLLEGIRQRAEEYGWGGFATILIERFGTKDVESLADAQLVQLRDTLAARLSARQKKEPGLGRGLKPVTVETGEPDWKV